jgi:hypothetical protein
MAKDNLKTIAVILLNEEGAVGKASAVPYRVFFRDLLSYIDEDDVSMAELEESLTDLFDDESTTIEKVNGKVFLDIQLPKRTMVSTYAPVASPSFAETEQMSLEQQRCTYAGVIDLLRSSNANSPDRAIPLQTIDSILDCGSGQLMEIIRRGIRKHFLLNGSRVYLIKT